MNKLLGAKASDGGGLPCVARFSPEPALLLVALQTGLREVLMRSADRPCFSLNGRRVTAAMHLRLVHRPCDMWTIAKKERGVIVPSSTFSGTELKEHRPRSRVKLKRLSILHRGKARKRHSERQIRPYPPPQLLLKTKLLQIAALIGMTSVCMPSSQVRSMCR